jgi:hypothetical protein
MKIEEYFKKVLKTEITKITITNYLRWVCEANIFINDHFMIFAEKSFIYFIKILFSGFRDINVYESF